MRYLALALGVVVAFGADAQTDAPTLAVGTAATVPSSTVAGLPACNAGATGLVYTVTNALTPALGLAVVGGGVVSVVVKCNGTSWLVGQ